MGGLQSKTLSVGNARIAGVLLTAEGLVRYRDVTLTNAQVLALRATPISLVPAPGSTKMLEFVSAIVVSNAAAGAWVESAANLVVRQTGTTGLVVSDVIETTGFFTAGIKATRARAAIDPIGLLKNAPLVLHNNGAGEFTGGNAANTLRVRIFYRIHGFADFGTFA